MDYYLGRFQLGNWVNIVLQCTDIDGSPAMPVDSPHLTIRRSSDGAVVYSKEMPVAEKEGQAIGLFVSRVRLGSDFAVGTHTIQKAFTVGADTFIESNGFDVVQAGNVNGTAIGTYYYRRPNAHHVLYQVESGRILRGSNPRID